MRKGGIAPFMVVILLGLAVVAGMYFAPHMQRVIDPDTVVTEPVDPTPYEPVTRTEAYYACGADLSGIIRVLNTNQFDTDAIDHTTKTFYVSRQTADGGWQIIRRALTTPDDGTYEEVEVECGRNYRIDFVATSGSEASKIVEVSGEGTELTADGAALIHNMLTTDLVVETRSGATTNLEFRAYDGRQVNQLLRDDSSADWVGTGSTFGDEVNGSPIAVGAGETFEAALWFRSDDGTAAWDDHGAIIAFGGDVSIWDFENAGYTLENAEITDYNPELSARETQLLSAYDKFVEFDSAIGRHPTTKLHLEIPVQGASVNPSDDDITIAFMLRGKYASVVNPNEIILGGATDHTPAQAVHPLEQITFDIAA